MANFGISKKAVADLDGIWKYTAQNWSIEQANRYYSQLHRAIVSLAALPEYLKLCYDEVKPGLLGCHVGHHIIFHHKTPDGTVWVDRILHEKMDFTRNL